LNSIVSLQGFQALGSAPGAFACAAQVQEEQQDRCRSEDKTQRLARWAGVDEPADHR
jgi:hypothetical protein